MGAMALRVMVFLHFATHFALEYTIRGRHLKCSGICNKITRITTNYSTLMNLRVIIKPKSV